MAEADVEWEDAEADDWEVLIADDDDAAAAVDTNQDIVVELETGGTGKKQVQRMVVTKERRLQCQAVHRVHLLCLLARLRLHDAAASGLELQARMLSLLQPQHLAPDFLASAADPKRAIHQLKQLVHWFNSAFAPMAHPDDETATLQSLTDSALQLKAGPAEILVVLFVALLRALGLLVRYVLLLDVLPLEPWRKAGMKPIRLISAQEAKAKEQAHSKKVARQQRQQAAEDSDSDETGNGAAAVKADSILDDEVEEAVRVLVAGAEYKKSYAVKALMADLAEKLPDVKFTRPQQAAIKKFMTELSASQKEVQKGRRKRGRAKQASSGSDGLGKRVKQAAPAASAAAKVTSTAVAAAGSGQATASAPAQQPALGGKVSAAAGRSLAAEDDTRVNLGEQEFDRELQLALMATAAEAEARQLRRLAQPGPTAAPIALTSDHRVKGVKAELLGRRSQASGGAQSKGFGALTGQVSGSRTGLVPTVWAEVYCGTAEAGRWVHVDVINSLLDRPETVEAATQRARPAAYIVASSPVVSDRETGCTAHDSGSSSSTGSQLRSDTGASASTPFAMQELKDVTNRYVSSLLGLQKLRDNAWWEETLALLSGSAPVSAPGSAQPPAPASTAAEPAQAGPSASVVNGTRQQLATAPSAEALRAKREDAELHHRAVSQLQGLPTTLEGFKAHPMYILKRHFTKYQMLKPGAVVLGTHRGEAFFARSAVSELHTLERWRREGREVRADELGKPCKVVAKRKQPPAPGTSRVGGYGSFSRRDSSGKGGAGKRNTGKYVDVDDDDNLGEGPAEEEGTSPAGPTVDLYGDWQTQPWVRPQARNGRVPKNERGNVDCPPLVRELPLGTVHVQYPGIWMVCRDLDVDYAPALVGFEVQAGRMLPKIDGVVICEEFEQQVVAAYLERETAKQDALAARRRREALGGWFQLLQAMRTRLQLQTSYEQAETSAPVAQQSDVIDLTDGAEAGGQSQRELQLRRLKDQYNRAVDREGAVKDKSAGMDVEEI